MAKRVALPTVCLVLSEHLTNHYVGPLARGASAAAARLGARLVMYSPLNVRMDRRDFTPAELPMLPRRADAFLVPSNVADDILEQICRGGAPVLTYAGVRPDLPSIGPDNRGGARDATAHLIAHGRRRIVHLAGLPDSDEARERLAGYRDALDAAGIAYDDRLVAYGHFRIQEAEDATEELLRRGAAPDAIFAANDLEAQGAMRALARAGLRVPDDVAIVGFDDSVGSDALDPPLSTVRQSAFQLGWDALALLARAAGRPLPERTLVPVRLVARRSCGCGARAAAPDLFELLGAGQAPLVSAEQAAAWAEPVRAALDAGQGWDAAIDSAIARAEGAGWTTSALHAVVARWREGLRDAEGLRRALDAGDYLAAALDARDAQREVGRARRLDAITYVIDLLREYGYEQSSEAALRYMVNSGPQMALVAQRAAFGDLILALRVDAQAGAATWQGASETFPPTAWLAPGDTMLLMPMDAGPHHATLVGLVERGAPAHLELDDLLLRSINTYRSVTALHETLRELDAARSVQLSLLPRHAPVSDTYDVAGAARAARQVGGDLYGYYPRADGGLAIALGDVAGKGLPAALLMSACATALAGAMPAGLPPGASLAQIHRVLAPSVGRGQNAALCLVHLDGDQARIANAGLITPFVVGADGVRAVDIGGLPLGVGLSGRTPYAEARLRLARGDLLVLVTDGIVEAMDERRELFGFARLEQSLAEGPRHSAAAMLDHIFAAVSSFAGDTEAHDDMAVVVARYR